VRPLSDTLVVDLTRNLPGPFASRELLRLGARVVRLESPEGDPVRDVAPEWDAALNAGKESVVCDLKQDPEVGRALLARADVVLEGFRPGVAKRLGVGPEDAPDTAVYCSITGFGEGDPRVGHDLNYMGWAGALAATAPAMPPLPIADLAAGALTAVTRILAGLLERARSGRGSRIVVSMTHEAHELGNFAGPLTGQLPYYRIYETADGKFVTLAALEPHFWRRFCEVVERPDLLDDRNGVHGELETLFRGRSYADWLELFDGEDVCVGPVVTLNEAAPAFGRPPVTGGPPPRLGEHTEAWRGELGL
jgi:crotonobetainyl-CoA:carnitine CoA-transferase CaiB-like acyl-CoA transferase